MDSSELLTDAFGRISELYADTAAGLDDRTLHHRPGGTGNSIAWLLWHTARLQDDHLVGITGQRQLWETWQARFGLDNGTDDFGYGHTSEQVDAVRISDPQLLADYQADVHRELLRYLAGVDADELDRVVDRRWDPPVTAGVRLVSLLADCLEHLGQAAYVRGLTG